MKAYNKVALPLRLLVEAYGYLVAFPLILLIESSRLTCKFEFEGRENLENHPHAIWACWHEFVVCSFITYPVLKKYSRHQTWLNHPAWIMRPTHRLMNYLDIDVVMGASGEHGRAAGAELLKRLKEGESTSINPDGPAGPQRRAKSGVLNLARDSGLPVLAIQYELSTAWTWPGWDRKQVPFPFSKIKIRISNPIFVSGTDDKSAMLEASLSGTD